MKVLNFDLSTVCIGVLAVAIDPNTKKIKLMKSCPIMPAKFDPSSLGFMKSKKKLPTKNGEEEINTWCYKGEKTVSKAEKKKRDIRVREEQNKFLLSQISRSIGEIIDTVQPDLINVEKNAMFNGILTIELLAKVMGTLIGIASSKGIPFNEYKVQTVRQKHNAAKLVVEFSKKHKPEYLANLEDVTKAAFRNLMQEKYKKYGLELQTDDEGDACVVFDYWYEEVYLNG